MSWVRAIVGIVVGVALIAAGAVALFEAADMGQYDAASWWFMILATLWGVAIALGGGWLSQAIAGVTHLMPSAVVSVLIIASAVSSMITAPPDGSVWGQMVAIVFMGPAATAGGWMYTTRLGYMAPPET